MSGYVQPTEYKFSHDSIELAQRTAAILSEPVAKVLDLCAGCGVVGLELAKILSKRSRVFSGTQFDFVEVQAVYRSFFEANLESAGLAKSARWIELNYATLLARSEFVDVYDLVISNPPYFDSAQGSLPPSGFKARCRFFLDSDFETMWRAIVRVLKPGGEAFVLVRDLSAHGLDRASTLDRVLAQSGEWWEEPPVRGTRLVRFKKH